MAGAESWKRPGSVAVLPESLAMVANAGTPGALASLSQEEYAGTGRWETAMNAAWIRRGATALAAARTALGVVALTSPQLAARPWVGAVAEGTPGRLLARALGGRDLALGLGALAALQRLPLAGTSQSGSEAGLWVGMGAMADSVDLLATAIAWRQLPPVGRWLVAASAGGAAVAGAAAAWTLIAPSGEARREVRLVR
jgi:hypothetical protein